MNCLDRRRGQEPAISHTAPVYVPIGFGQNLAANFLDCARKREIMSQAHFLGVAIKVLETVDPHGGHATTRMALTILPVSEPPTSRVFRMIRTASLARTRTAMFPLAPS